jgi:putative NADPH-quinone reductase
MYVLGLAGSPRRHGNTEILLDEALMGAVSVGAHTEKLVLNDLDIRPCQACGGCNKTGICIQRDQGPEIYEKLRSADFLILASPVYFMGLAAQAKILVDRCQAQWVARYVLKRRHMYGAEGIRRRALFISVGARTDTNLFEGPLATVRSFFASLDFAFDGAVLYPGVDERGAIKTHPDALKQAYAAGVHLVRPNEPNEEPAPSSSSST